MSMTKKDFTLVAHTIAAFDVAFSTPELSLITLGFAKVFEVAYPNFNKEKFCAEVLNSSARLREET